VYADNIVLYSLNKIINQPHIQYKIENTKKQSIPQ
jgi:hypothetical protein